MKRNNYTYWLAVGVIAQLIAAPNISVMKVTLASVDPTTFNTLRAAVGAAVAAPFIIWFWRQLNRRNFMYAVAAGLSTAAAATMTTYAVRASQASYVIILSLLAPVILVLLSGYFFHEKVGLRAGVGIGLAAFGALVAVAVPLVAGSHMAFTAYPVAIILTLAASLFIALLIVFLRKANNAGLPLASAQGISAAVVMVISYFAAIIIDGQPVTLATVPASAWFGIVYSAVFVVFAARVMSTASYERIGAATTGGLNYLGIVAALIIPIVFLGETLSSSFIVGGILILGGVYLTERHRGRSRHAQQVIAH